MKVGNKNIPDFRLTSSTLIGDMKTLYEKFGISEVSQEVVAEVLGHKSAKSGTFLRKVASMRDYGLIDGRGKIRVTDIGEKIAFRQKEDEYNNAMMRAARKIPLWNMLLDKYTQKGLIPPEADFWLDLKQYCDLTIEEAKNLAPTMLNAFNEDIKFIRVSKPSTTPMGLESQSQQASQSQAQPQAQEAPEGFIPIGFGNVKVVLPKEKTLEAWNKLKAMVDAYVKAS